MKKEFEGKKLLILGGIRTSMTIVERAQAMGIYTIVADYDENSPAKAIADKAVLIDATDVDAIVKFCREEKVDGITTGYVDILLRGWDKMCRELDVPCYLTEKMLNMALDKVEFKKTCEQYDVPVPKTYFVGGELTQTVLEQIAYPVFVKPLDASGSRGCGVCYNEEELLAQFAQALSFSRSRNCVVEQFLTGREFLLDYIGVDGEFRLVEMFDRYKTPDRGSAMNFANISIAPSFAIDNYYKTVDEKVRNMFKQLGFRDGLIFLQGFVDGDRITFYEMGCRLGGTNYILEEACSGYVSHDMVIRHALTGKMLPSIDMLKKDIAKFSRYGVLMNFLLLGGDETIHTVKGIEQANQMPNAVRVKQVRFEGDYYAKDTIVDKAVASVHFTADTVEEIRDTIRYLNNVVEVTNREGKSLVTMPFDPQDLEDYES